MAFETIRRGREKLITFLQRAPDLILDDTAAQGFVSEADYEALDNLSDPKEKMRRLLVKVQVKGEQACHQFLEGIRSLFPDLPPDLWPPGSACSDLKEGYCPPDKALDKSGTENPEGEALKSKDEFSAKDSEDKEFETVSGGQEPVQEVMETENFDEIKKFLKKVGLHKRHRKLTMGDILEITSESLTTVPPQTPEDLPWHFLRKLMALSGTARNTDLVPQDEGDSNEEGDGDEDGLFAREMESVNPLDVLCAVLLCCDSFLRQEIFLKMSMCQFALPLVLPPPKQTFMLWALRDIVRKWRPHCLIEQRGFREESLVKASMPTVSFVRLGRPSLSKSRLLNEVLSSPQQHHDFFLHRDMECGNTPREISDGLVEISWYFPGGRGNLDLFPEPVAVTNLRGDIESHWPQFSFLTQVSSAVLIILEKMSDKQYDMLATLQGSASKYYFVLNADGEKSKETLGLLTGLAPLLGMTKSQILVKEKNKNATEFVKKFRSAIRNIIISPQKVISLEEMAKVSQELRIQTDEDAKICQNGILHANEIIEEIKDVVAYKKKMLKLQGELWRNLAEVEKELCRMKRQADVPVEDYKADLREQQIALRLQQYQCDLTTGITKFINGLQQLHPAEKHFFLKWLKFSLDCSARANLSKLREEYKEHYQAAGNDPKHLAQLDESISASSLGVEHFMRELGQFYEAEYTMVKEGKANEEDRQFVHLPGIAADLMLEGFPMELIDGDASNIPLQWVTDVLTALHSKLEGKSRMKVLTVLGVQSTGKSTLLNTMFGLQFAVSSGRCTRGAFMTLLRVSENFRRELHCDFILVIDTEGLKAPELAKLEDSYEHDNELATLVIGLSDITLVNLAMENATEMKDILQIVVHAFLRMEETGHRPNCQFVHQNVSDVSAHDQNMRDRKRLLEQLNDMTRAAAKMEKQFREVSFSDIMEYNPESHNWYIPGLWHGVPPMAPVNMAYSEGVSDMKRSLFEFMRTCSQNRCAKDIPQFVEWVRSLWNAVKHENFIFSFRNSLVADAYNQLSAKYSEWEWDFQKEMHLWVSKADTAIQNHSVEDIESGALDKLRLEADQKLHDGQQKILQCIQNYFERDKEGLHLIEKYREDFIRSAKGLQEQLRISCLQKCQQAVLIRKGQNKIDNLQAGYMKTMESKVNKLLEECKRKKRQLSSSELNWEFENMWKETLLELAPSNLTPRNIYADVYHQLQKDLAVHANQHFQTLPIFSAGCRQPFTMKGHYLKNSAKKLKGLVFKDGIQEQLEEYTSVLNYKCWNYVTEKTSTKRDYDETYCRELLRLINEQLHGKDFHKLYTTVHFEVDLKYSILGDAADAFQKMHTEFFKANNPHRRLEKLKPQYLSTFKDLYHEKDACQKRAKDFCNLCLKPALEDHLQKRLGIEIVDDFLSSGQSLQYGSRSFFQFTVQKTLLEEQNFENYVKYINRYEEFVKSWIQAHLLDHYRQRKELAILGRKILSAVLKKAKDVLEGYENETGPLAKFLEDFCQEMSAELIIPKDALKVILFNNTADAGSLSAEIRACIPTVTDRILSERFEMSVEAVLSGLLFKPQDEIFKKVFGCGKQCPFCKVPCEAGGGSHQEHFASVHRPEGLGRYHDIETNILVYSLCSSSVHSNGCFRNADTGEKLHLYKEYRQYYPDWRIQADPSITASDYWRFVFKTFNRQFAKEYRAIPADLPKDWERLTKQQALESIQETFNMK
ncbi:up-regulator of cell proliferation-like isoform X2 [Paroedura picta]